MSYFSKVPPQNHYTSPPASFQAAHKTLMRPENTANLIFPAQCRYRSDDDYVFFGRCVCQSEGLRMIFVELSLNRFSVVSQIEFAWRRSLACHCAMDVLTIAISSLSTVASRVKSMWTLFHRSRRRFVMQHAQKPQKSKLYLDIDTQPLLSISLNIVWNNAGNLVPWLTNRLFQSKGDKNGEEHRKVTNIQLSVERERVNYSIGISVAFVLRLVAIKTSLKSTLTTPTPQIFTRE